MMMQSIRQLEKALNASTRRVDELGMENEKLRGLVRDLWWQLLNAYDYKEVDDFADRMHELGIVVG